MKDLSFDADSWGWTGEDWIANAERLSGRCSSANKQHQTLNAELLHSDHFADKRQSFIADRDCQHFDAYIVGQSLDADRKGGLSSDVEIIHLRGIFQILQHNFQTLDAQTYYVQSLGYLIASGYSK